MALLLTAELLRFAPEAHRAQEVVTALARAAASAGVTLKTTQTYRGGADVLVLWGPGHPARFEPMRRQIESGRHVMCLDLSYWQRETKFRVSIDAAHPQSWVLRKDWPASRLEEDRVAVSDRWSPSGPVIVAGLGRKARVQYGADRIDAWELGMIAAARASGRDVFYRRKQDDAPVPSGVHLSASGPIEHVLSGASLLITWHSNVAVDAIRMGIPVVCADGAAAAICPSALPSDPKPVSVAVRDRFLRNLAWFQWSPREAKACWQWLREALA